MKSIHKTLLSYLLLLLLFTGCHSEKTITESTISNNTNNENQLLAEPPTEIKEVPTTTASTLKESPPKGNIEVIKLSLKSLENNLINDSTTRKIRIYLPPSYAISDQRYPVVYFLHGFTGQPGDLIASTSAVDKAMTAENMKEFIVVEPSGSNLYNGSFYVNSQATGNYEDYIINELIEYVDTHYRTINDPSARGISGFSMGGYGALNLGMKHTDIYTAVLAVSPGVFPKEGVSSAMKSWEGDTQFLNGYGQAFAPRIEDEKSYPQIPQFDGTTQDQLIIDQWNAGFGNLQNKIVAYQSYDKQLTGLKIMYSDTDYYDWIPAGCKYLGELLTESKIDYELESYYGGHTLPGTFISKDFVPYFSNHLSFEVTR